MTDHLLDLIRSIVILMEEETARLTSGARTPDMAETAQAKVRLVAALETANAKLARENPRWMEDLSDEEREPLREAVAALRDKMQRAGAGVVEQLGGALDRTMTALEPYLLQLRIEMGAANA